MTMSRTRRPCSDPTAMGPDDRAMPATTPRSISTTDLIALLYLGAVWGGAFLFFRIAAPEVGAVWAAEIRIALGAAILGLVAGRRTFAAVRRRPLQFVIVGATFSAIPFSLIAVAALTLPAGLGALLNASTPLFTAVLGVAVLGQRLTPRLVAGLGIGLAAVFVLVGWSPVGFGPELLVATAAALAAALSYAIAGTLVKRTLPDVAGMELATGQLALGAIVLLPFAIASGGPGMPSLGGAASLLVLGVVSTALAWPVFFRVMSRTTPTVASTVTFIVPAFAILWGGLVLAEPVGPGLVAGFGLVLVSLVLIVGLRLPLPALPGRRPVRRVEVAAPS